jgi:hypothetical protein
LHGSHVHLARPDAVVADFPLRWLMQVLGPKER